jgi:hypothetical protein
MEAFTIENKTRYEFLTPVKISTWDKEKYIPFGTNNDAPSKFAQLSREVLAHKAVINRKTFYCSGTKFVTENPQLQDLILNINPLGVNDKTLKSVFKKNLKDDFIGGRGIFEVVTDSKFSFLNLLHADFTKFRLARDLKGMIYSPDWNEDWDKSKNVFMPFYGKGWLRDGKFLRSLVTTANYEPEFINSLPDWYAGLRSIIISGLTNEKNKKDLENGYFKNGILILDGVNDATAAKKVQDKINEDSGADSDNSGKILVGYQSGTGVGETKVPPKLIDFNNKMEGSYTELHKLSDEQIVRIHNWYLTLAGMNVSTGFDTNRINDEYRVALSTVIKPIQEEYLNLFKQIFNDFGYKADDLTIQNDNPVQPEVLKVTDNEVRKKVGLEMVDGGDEVMHELDIYKIWTNGTNNSGGSNNGSV